MLIKKVKNTIAIVAKVAQSLTNNSETDVPSVKAVKNAITTIKNDVLNTVYPIGAIYLSMNSTNPSSLFGGTWKQIAQGRTLVGVNANDSDFSSSGKTGGEKTHTLTVDEMPSHRHNINFGASVGGDGSGFVYSGTSGNNNAFMHEAGGGQAHNNLQPYFTCYIWKRTA